MLESSMRKFKDQSFDFVSLIPDAIVAPFAVHIWLADVYTHVL